MFLGDRAGTAYLTQDESQSIIITIRTEIYEKTYVELIKVRPSSRVDSKALGVQPRKPMLRHRHHLWDGI